MIKTKEQLMEQLKGILGDNMSDEAVALVEDVNDTVSDFEARTADSTDWKKKYEDNDNAWRQKYRDRFFAPVNDDEQRGTGKNPAGGEEKEDKPLTYNNLFIEEGGTK